jgi:hypothetical protein
MWIPTVVVGLLVLQEHQDYEAQQEQPDSPEPQDQGLPDHLVQQVFREQLDLLEQQVPLGSQEPLVLLVPQEPLVFKAQLVLLEPLVLLD